jgi:hypothetical protein
MFIKRNSESKLDAEINSQLDKLSETENAEEYDKIVERVTKLQKLKPERLKPISADTMLVVAANIFGILWLARYERENVIKSRSALGLVMKPRP